MAEAIILKESLEDNQNCGHIVAANAGHSIRCHQLLEEILDDLFLVFALEVTANDVDDALIVLHVVFPDPVAAKEDKLVTLPSLELPHVGFASDHLLVPRHLFTLVVEVSEGAGEV